MKFNLQISRGMLNIYYLLIKTDGVVTDVTVESMADGDSSKLLGADISRAEERELAGTEVRIRQEEEIGDGEAQCGVAEELEALVRGRLGVGGVSQGFLG